MMSQQFKSLMSSIMSINILLNHWIVETPEQEKDKKITHALFLGPSKMLILFVRLIITSTALNLLNLCFYSVIRLFAHTL